MSEEKKKVSFAYEEMLHMPHHVSGKHPQMSRYDRAAQFSPFAALTGHEAAVQEAARVTEERAELDEGEKERLRVIRIFRLPIFAPMRENPVEDM